MNKAILLGFFLCSTLICLGQTKYDLSINLEGKQREFIVSIPSTLPPSEGYPIVFMLHGSSGDKNVFYNAYGWSELGEKENFITVFPSSLRWCFEEDGTVKNNTKWVCGELKENICPKDSADLVDDVRFLKRIVQLITDTFQVNESKIFCSGFSNGSCMTHKIAMEAGDVFAACAGSAGSLASLDSTQPTKRVPIWFTLGDLDDRYIVPPFVRLPYGADSILGYLNKNINRALECQGLSNTFQKIENANMKTYVYNVCQPGVVCAPYLFSLIKNLEHQFPNGRNHVVDDPALFWQFFNNPPPTVTGTNDPSSNINFQVQALPNPSNDQIEIVAQSSGTKQFTAEVYNIYGERIIILKSANGRFKINQSQCGKGLFLVSISNGIQLGSVKIIFN